MMAQKPSTTPSSRSSESEMDHFIIPYSPNSSDDWLCCIVYFNSLNIDATSWLCIYEV